MTKLFIGGLRKEITELDIAMLVSFHGDLKVVKVVRDRKTRSCKGYAFIEVATDADAKNIIKALNEQKFQGQLLTVKEMEEEEMPKLAKKKPH